MKSRALFLALVCVAAACAEDRETRSTDAPSEAAQLTITLTPEGLSWRAPEGHPLSGVQLVAPPGAVDESVDLTLRLSGADIPLPARAYPLGPYVTLEPQSLKLSAPITVTVPVIPGVGAASGIDIYGVKVWYLRDDDWDLVDPLAIHDDSTTIQLQSGGTLGAGVKFEVPEAMLSCPEGCDEVVQVADGVHTLEPGPRRGGVLPSLVATENGPLSIEVTEHDGQLALSAVGFEETTLVETPWAWSALASGEVESFRSGAQVRLAGALAIFEQGAGRLVTPLADEVILSLTEAGAPVSLTREDDALVILVDHMPLVTIDLDRTLSTLDRCTQHGSMLACALGGHVVTVNTETGMSAVHPLPCNGPGQFIDLELAPFGEALQPWVACNDTGLWAGEMHVLPSLRSIGVVTGIERGPEGVLATLADASAVAEITAEGTTHFDFGALAPEATAEAVTFDGAQILVRLSTGGILRFAP
ncbi:MAG: hypothetical protein ACE366_12770 [Bradymonadia bacterium]